MSAALARPAPGAIMEEALDWADIGVPVFLLRPGDKRPMPGSRGFKDATTDKTVIRARFAENPDANYALFLHGAGLCAVDIDGAAGEAAWAEWVADHGPTPPTHAHITPRGGRHLIFKGVLPSTAGKITEHVDTRGEGGYIVGSGCVIDERSGLPEGNWGTYTEEFDCPPAAALPPAVAEAAGNQREAVKAAPGVELDTPANLARAVDALKRQGAAVQGQGGDTLAFETAAVLSDLGVSVAMALELMLEHWNPRCEPPWDEDELAVKVGNGFRYAQNEPGCHALGETPEEFKRYAAAAGADARTPGLTFTPDQPSDHTDRVSRLRGRSVLAYANLPALEYHDAAKTLPKMAGGASGLLIGGSGAGKTTVVLALIGDAIMSGARVLYCASEGAFGLGKQRFPALAAALNITLEKLAEHVSLVDEAVNLLDHEDVEALVEANANFRPDIVVIDTLAASSPGADENSAATASLMSGGGAVGQIKRAFNATVVVLHHTGKDETRGARGSSAFEGNADFVHELKADKEAGVARLHVRKMRDGPDGFNVHFKVEPGLGGVPIARQISEDEYRVRSKASMSADRVEVGQALRKLGPGPHTTHVLASALVGPIGPNEEPEAHQRRIESEGKRLRRLAGPTKAGLGPLTAYAIRGEGRNSPTLWALPASSFEEADDV